MPNVAFNDAIAVADIAALKAINLEERADKSLRLVTSPGNSLPPTWYQFLESSTIDELSPAIVASTNGTGRWLMVGTPLYFATDVPNSAPPITGMKWIFGSRVWESIATSNLVDWIELSNRIIIKTPQGETFSNITTLQILQGLNVTVDSQTAYLYRQESESSTGNGITVSYDLGEGIRQYQNTKELVFEAKSLFNRGDGIVSYLPTIAINDSYYAASRINFSSQFSISFSNGVAEISLAAQN